MSEGKDIYTWVHLHMYKFSKEGLTKNKQYTNQSNILFELALKRKT
jgi:hypothetical protein